MNAGAGIIHSECPSQDLTDRNGTQELIQLWINTPADKKMKEPKYQFLAESDIPVFISADELITNKLIAGNYDGLQSKITTEIELLIIWGAAQKGGTQTFHQPELFNVMLYVIRGTVRIKAYGRVDEESLAIFDSDSELMDISAETDAQFLLVAGNPINEKVVQQGPFVMNTTTEILEAMRDYRIGKMGILIEEK